jgi:hypothetical protein
MAQGKVAVDVQGFRDFRRDLKRLDASANKALSSQLRETGGVVLVRAKAIAPRLTGELADSLRLSVTQRAVTIYSTLPQAPVLHWGGKISPRGVPIIVPRTEFISQAAEERGDELVEDLGRDIDHAAQLAGWH